MSFSLVPADDAPEWPALRVPGNGVEDCLCGHTHERIALGKSPGCSRLK